MAVSIERAVSRVRERIGAAAERSGRDPASVLLIGVTKTVNASGIREAREAGIVEFGENRVQEALDKQAQVDDPSIRWHLIGHLQTNKAQRAATTFACVHSIDSERIARALGARRSEARPGGALRVLVEVDLIGGETRTGTRESDLDAVVAAVSDEASLILRGLMTVPAQEGGAAGARAAFGRLRRLRDEVEQRLGLGLPELSMGMSDDFEIAIEEGATMVRIGRLIFGTRPHSI